MKVIYGILLLHLFAVSVYGQDSKTEEQEKLENDRQSIKSMAGCYSVTFKFAETFAPDTSYKYHDRKFDRGIEYVFVVEENEKFISLQHLLIVSDSVIIKHWRQDWAYENTELLSFYKDNEWKKIKLTPGQAKGTWTQKVYQVDDSPRYEGYGTWNHVDGRHFWESTADAPLPRREFMKRSDYNVLRRHSRVEISSNGWILEQDNEKIIRENGNDRLLCWEKGFETFTKGNYNCQPAIDWWTENQRYWADVRVSWDEIFKEHPGLKLQKRVNGDLLYEKLFELGDKYAEKKDYPSSEARKAIKQIIESYIIKS